MELRTPEEISSNGRKAVSHLGGGVAAITQRSEAGNFHAWLWISIAHDLIVNFGDIPAFLNYRPGGAQRAYPQPMLCTSQ